MAVHEMEANLGGLILCPTNFKDLEERKIINHPKTGWHRVWQSLNTLKQDGSINYDTQGHPFYDEPKHLESLQALEVIGFSHKKATELWKHWCAVSFEWFSMDARVSVIEFAVDYTNGYAIEVHMTEDVESEDVRVTMEPLMKEMGISEEMIWRMESENFAMSGPLSISRSGLLVPWKRGIESCGGIERNPSNAR